MMGWSHGGCVTLRAVQRGARVDAAIVLHGVTDWLGIYDFFQEKVALAHLTSDLRAVYSDVIAKLEASAGGTPDEAPEGYLARSPMAFPQALANFEGDLLMLQGASDPFVPLEQACAFSAAAGDFHAYFVDDTGAVGDGLPPPCNGDAFLARDERPSVPVGTGSRQLGIYAGAGHGIRGDAVPTRRIANAVLRFLTIHLRE